MKTVSVWLVLMGLTIASFLLANEFYPIYLIVGLFTIKFLFVSFQYMELRKAHLFWKVTITLIVALINLLVILI